MNLHRSGRIARWQVAATTLLMVAAICPTLATAAEPETLETVLAVWRKREAATKTLRVVIDEEYFRGAAHSLEGAALGGRPAKMNVTLAIDGTNFRHDRVGEWWPVGAEQPDDWTRYEAIDGQRAKQLNRATGEDAPITSFGSIRAAAKHPFAMQRLSLVPILRHYRPLSPPFGLFQLDSLKLISTTEKIGGDRCILLQEVTDAKPGVLSVTRKYWVAPEKEMAILRVTSSRDGIVNNEMDISFKLDVKKRWIPASWKGRGYGDKGKRLSNSNSDTVVEIEINPEVPASTFDFEFPRGTEVMDHIANRKFIAK